MKAFIWYVELVTGQSVISAVSAPRQRVSLCVPIIAPVFLRLPKYLREISRIYEIVRFYARTIDAAFRRWARRDDDAVVVSLYDGKTHNPRPTSQSCDGDARSPAR